MHCLHGRPAVARAVLAAVFAGGLASAAGGQVASDSTAIGTLARAMKPGEWRQLETSGYSPQLVSARYTGEMAKYNQGRDSIFNYSDAAAWDSKTRRLFFVGLGHYAALKFISYAAETNAWTLLPVPPWADPRKRPEGHWPRGHAYSKNTVDPITHRLLFGYGTTTIHQYDIDAERWLEPIRVEKGMPTFKDANNGIRAFPELGGIVRFWKGRLHLYSWREQTWRELCDVPGVGMHCVGEYVPKARVMVFGGGDVGDKPPALYRLDAEGRVTRLKEPRLSVIHVQGTLFVAEPVTGQILAGQFRGQEPRTLYALDPLRDEWQRLDVSLPPGRHMVAAGIPNYGVTMVCTATPAAVWLYKHKSP